MLSAGPFLSTLESSDRFLRYYNIKILTLLTSGGRSIGIVRLRTEATEFFMYKYYVTGSYLNTYYFNFLQ
jgi:hypothetical protein